MSRLYHVLTWGCQMNEHDSEKLAGLLEGLGWSEAPDPESADLVLLNTCAVREKAEEKVHGMLDRLGHLRRTTRPDLLVAFCGCVGQLRGEEIPRRWPFVRLVFGPRNLPDLPAMLAELARRDGPIVRTDLSADNLRLPGSLARRDPERPKAWLTIMEGCDKSCAYCIVPRTRGREEYRSLDDILAEVRLLAEEGFPEIELLGQNVNAWRDPGSGAGFDELLRRVAREGRGVVRRIRFATSHPVHLSTAIVRAMAEVPEVCDALHLPVQSGSSRVLRAMRRGYDRETYLRKVTELREAIPGIALSTDVIVGFPGETEDDFEDTMTLLEEVGFEQVFSFVFSPRPGTAAAEIDDPEPRQRKLQRLARLQERQRHLQLARNRSLVGRTFEVLVEGRARRDAGEWAGRTTTNRVVNFPGPADLRPGRFVRVEITGAGPNSLRGRLAPEPSA